MSVATVGLDIAKQFFQVHGVDVNGRVVESCVGAKYRLFLRTYQCVRWDWRLAADLTIGCVC